MEQAVPELMSKGDFAKLINVSAGRVSQYISEGKLSGDAIEGEGRRAKIRTGPALRQLQLKLDISQMLGNGLDTRLDPQTMPAAASDNASYALPLGAPKAPTVSPDNRDRAPTVEERLKNEKLFQAQIRSRKEAEEDEKRKGRFTETDKVEAQMARLLSKMIQTYEGSLPDLANAIAENFEVPARDVLHLLRGEFRSVRERAAEQARREAEELPSTVETEIAQ
ncbi:hypothetical protein [Roseibium alexandrii]|uniref:Uncharacterized protein n=1 Tax=Roseibium alexandrii (strain DSM 17067 / NCIMB 14079 / DFL-11) TaxID=244592 RepID=A0A5E8H432_ROSAD|nr:hypothetical protein [Roseibium alexandrii]EEE47253.1 hypothetical protein SADFL11_4542 [Roseibium alexandrii DFL-11]